MPNTTTRRRFALNAPQQQISPAINGSVTSISVPSFSGWPTQFPFYAALEIGTASLEIVSVTNIVGTTATVTRAQRGTAAIAHPLGATMDMVAVDQDYDEANAHSSATSGLHGVAGNIVGDTDAQTLTNKTVKSMLGTTTAGTPVITATAAAAADKVFSGRNSSSTETSSINDAGNLISKGTLTQGSSGQLTSDASGNLSTSGSLTTTGTGALTVAGAANLNGAGTGLAVANNATVGGTLVVTSAAQASSFAGILVPKSFANEAAAGTATAGYIVYLTAPTGAGYSAGIYRGNGTIWVPENLSNDANYIQTLLYSGGTATSFTTNGTPTTWVSFGNVTVPAWATKVIVDVHLHGVTTAGTSGNTAVKVLLGSAGGAVNKRILDPAVANQRFQYSIVDSITGISTGSQALILQTTWTAGSAYVVDATTIATVKLTFLP